MSDPRTKHAQGGQKRTSGPMGFWQASAIGVGGMIGAGIFSVLGVAAGIAGPATGLAFVLAGALALVCGWSFGRLGARYPSAGGPVEYLARGLGDGLGSRSLNLLLWAGYTLAIALYARAFADYGTSLLPPTWKGTAEPVLITGVTLGFLALNLAGAQAVGRLELAIVAIKVCILLGFVAVVAPGISPDRVLPSAWPGPGRIAAAAAVVFLSYEGFGLITNAAEDMRDPKRLLPRSIMASIVFTIVIYVAVSITVLGTLSPDEVREASEYALAAAAKPRLGQAGFTLMAVAALFSTASAINATLYGGANVSARLAEKGGLPSIFRKRVWMGSPGSLLITGGLVLVLALLLDVERIAMTGSAAFLLVYGGVNVAHLRLRRDTGAARFPLLVGAIGCGVVFVVLTAHLVHEEPAALVGLGGLLLLCVLVELVWRHVAPHPMERRSVDSDS